MLCPLLRTAQHRSSAPSSFRTPLNFWRSKWLSKGLPVSSSSDKYLLVTCWSDNARCDIGMAACVQYTVGKRFLDQNLV